jgi:carbohydrate kinase (thermoresistant glucokinase family)
LDNKFAAIIVMGVSGCGKTSVGRLLAEHLGWSYIESDEYHSPGDIEKMSSGVPLNDEDRWPWLKRLHDVLLEHSAKNHPVVLACSALKQSYRDLLVTSLDNVFFVFLKGDFELIHQRMRQRQHYMKADMLRSQFEALEEPRNAMIMDIQQSPEKIVEKILAQIPEII